MEQTELIANIWELWSHFWSAWFLMQVCSTLQDNRETCCSLLVVTFFKDHSTLQWSVVVVCTFATVGKQTWHLFLSDNWGFQVQMIEHSCALQQTTPHMTALLWVEFWSLTWFSKCFEDQIESLACIVPVICLVHDMCDMTTWHRWKSFKMQNKPSDDIRLVHRDRKSHLSIKLPCHNH